MDKGNRKKTSPRPLIIWASLLGAGLLALLLVPTILLDNPPLPDVAPRALPLADEGGDRLQQTGRGVDRSGLAGGAQNDGQGGVPNLERVGLVTDAESSTVRAVERTRPAVVGVVNYTQAPDPLVRGMDWVEAGTGSGVIYEVEGEVARVVTNYHVIAGASEVEVVCGMGERTKAKILGYDPLTDLAVLEVPARFAKGVATFGNSDLLVPGQQTIAIGNPLGMDFSQTVTQGVVSAVNRAIPVDFDGDGDPEWEMDTIQTDAAINPGNSGGALVNSRGEVIGINSMKIADPDVEGLGFAIPSNDVLPIISKLEKEGRVRRAYMGLAPINLHSLTQEDRKRLGVPDEVLEGVVATEVNGPAAKAGLRNYDLILQLDEQTIKSAADLRRYLYTRKQPGDTLTVIYLRDGQQGQLQLQLAELEA